MVLRAHLSGPAALESACRAAHDRSELTRMILELLLIPSAPRPAPGSVTRCQAGQPRCSPSSLCSSRPWGPCLPVRLHPERTRPQCPSKSPFVPPSPPPCCFPGGAEPSRAALCTKLDHSRGKIPLWSGGPSRLQGHFTRTLGLRWAWHPKKASNPLYFSFPASRVKYLHPLFLQDSRLKATEVSSSFSCCFYQHSKCHQ